MPLQVSFLDAACRAICGAPRPYPASLALAARLLRHPLPAATVDFLGAEILHAGAETPDVAIGVFDLAVKVSPEHQPDGLQPFGAGADGLFERGVGIVEVEVE